tara:strand:+ start:753 stop:1019 length:267 start_codon:yes stop_codon:yes gene_type:complete
VKVIIMDEKNLSVQGEVNWTSTTLDILSPKKMLVESATMIFILAFMMFSLVVLIWKGPSLGTGEMMAMFFGLILTVTIAIRQYASFRY